MVEEFSAKQLEPIRQTLEQTLIMEMGVKWHQEIMAEEDQEAQLELATQRGGNILHSAELEQDWVEFRINNEVFVD